MTVIDQFPRRAFLRGLIALGASGLVAAPAIVRVASLDLPPVRHLLEATRDDVKRAMHAHSYGATPEAVASILKTEVDSPVFRQAQLVFDGQAYNQRTGLWEQGLSRETLASRPDRLRDSLRRGEWM